MGEPLEKPVRIVDTDVHNMSPLYEEIKPFLPASWRPVEWSRFSSGTPLYSTPGPAGIFRADAMTKDRRPGSDPDLMRTQLLEDAKVDFAILWPLVCRHVADPEEEVVVCAAVNEWMAATWLSRDNPHGQYRGTITITGRDIPAAVREIEKYAGDRRFSQIGFDPVGIPPIGSGYFEPVFAAAQQADLPLAMHFITSPGMNQLSPVGFMAYGFTSRVRFPFTYATHVCTAVSAGVFDRFPRLRLISIEAGISWVVPLFWRMQNHWKLLGVTAQRSPFDYLAENLRFTTQPIEEPNNFKDLHQLLEWAQAERSVMFSTDYPHFDFDSPEQVARWLPDSIRSRVMYENALEVYRLPATRRVARAAAVA